MQKIKRFYFLYREHSSHYYNEGPGPGSGHGHYDRLRGRPPHLSIDQYSESSYRSDADSAHNTGYFSSEDLLGPDGHQAPPLARRFGDGPSKRPTIGQPYACQSSPTQPHPPEKKPFPKQSDQDHPEDASVKQGLRSWRIHSYLSAYDDGGEEGLSKPLGPDAFEDPPPAQQPTAAESSAPHYETQESSNAPFNHRRDITRPRFGKPVLPESTSKALTTTKDLPSSASDLKTFEHETRMRDVEKEREREQGKDAAREMGGDEEMNDAPDRMLSKYDSFRSRINPLLQRSSRLRSSLIFSSSKAEIHSGSLGLKLATEEDEELSSGRNSSVVAQILEKRRSASREPFDWRKKAEEKDDKELQQQGMVTRLKDVIEAKEESQNIKEVKINPTVDSTKDVKSSSLNMNDPASRLQYFKDLAERRNASKIETRSSVKAPEPPEKKPDLPDNPSQNTTVTAKDQTVSISSADSEPKKTDIATKIAELNRRSSFSSSKPPLASAKPSLSFLKSSEPAQTQKKDDSSDGHKKDIFKSLKPLPSPKIFRDHLKFKGLNPRRTSCGEEVLTTDATDAEKSELKKSRSLSTSTTQREDFKTGLQKNTGSNTSINTLGGETKSEGKPLDFLKKQTQRLKGFLGPKDKKTSGDERGMSTVREITEDSSKKQSPSTKDTGSTPADQTATNHKIGISGPSRYQSPGSSVLFSSNLRDDTKVILEQISANSQKNRLEREEAGGDRDGDARDKGLERQSSIKRSRFLRPQGNNQEREGLLKRIESMRKEKKVYSRFEVVYNCKDDICSVDGKNI